MTASPAGWIRTADDRRAAERVRDAIGHRKVVLAHDYLIQNGGAERVLGVIADLIPSDRLLVLCADHRAWGKTFHGLRIKTSAAQLFLLSPRRFRALLPIYPVAASRIRIRDADLLVSSSSAFIKAARIDGGKHLCYCYTPLRLLYQPNAYLAGFRARWLIKPLISPLLANLRQWDLRTSHSQRIHRILTISRAVQERVRRFWGRESSVVHPPVDVQRAAPRRDWAPDGYLLVVARLLAYKRLDLAVLAASKLGRSLHVIGDGPDRRRLERLAGSSVRFLGWVSDQEVMDQLRGAAALLFPGEEDFGIAPVEAMAVGTPTVAYSRGGALDTVVDGLTGVLFTDQTVDGLIASLSRLTSMSFRPDALRTHSERFAPRVFASRLAEELEQV